MTLATLRRHMPYLPRTLQHRRPCPMLPLTTDNVCHSISTVLTQLEGWGVEQVQPHGLQWSGHVADMASLPHQS